MTPLTTFVDAAIITVAGSGTVLFLTLVKSLFSFGKKLDYLVKSNEQSARTDVFLVSSTGAGLRGQLATLEALKGNCNGNVDEAHRIVTEELAKYDAFLISSMTKTGG